MAAPGIVEPEGAAQSCASRGHALASVKIRLLVLYTPPRPFHEDVVHPAPLAVHAARLGGSLEGLGPTARAMPAPPVTSRSKWE